MIVIRNVGQYVDVEDGVVGPEGAGTELLVAVDGDESVCFELNECVVMLEDAADGIHGGGAERICVDEAAGDFYEHEEALFVVYAGREGVHLDDVNLPGAGGSGDGE